jgi:hypothetical protein
MTPLHRVSRRVFAAVLIAAAGSLAAPAARAAVAYDYDRSAESSRQQNGNNLYAIGDDFTLAAGSPRGLDSITITFDYRPADPSLEPTYTPTDVRIDVYEIDAATRIPLSATPLATSHNTSMTVFPGASAITPANFRDLTFDFANVTLPAGDHYAFVYRDESGSPHASFGLPCDSGNEGANIGATLNGLLATTTNSATPPASSSDFAFAQGIFANRNALFTVVTSEVPEPGSAAVLLVLGSMLIARRRA